MNDAEIEERTLFVLYEYWTKNGDEYMGRDEVGKEVPISDAAMDRVVRHLANLGLVELYEVIGSEFHSVKLTPHGIEEVRSLMA
ncbi:MAG: hypothetical protein PVH29_06065 [Candidatus Zixiibacteriota bacterium]|jgi:hypothetical protein